MRLSPKSPRYTDPEKTPRKSAPSLPPSFYSYDSRDRGSAACFRACCFWCCISFILVILLFVSITVMFYFWFRPQAPNIHVESFKIAKFVVEPPPVKGGGGPVLDAESTIRVGIENPNHHLKMLYDKTKVLLKSQSGVSLGELAVPAFVQGTNNATTLDFTLTTKAPLEGESGKELQQGYESKTLMVVMQLESGVGVKAAGLRVGPFTLHAMCQGIRLSENGSGGSPKCWVKMFHWTQET